MYNRRSFIAGSISLGLCLNPYNISIAQQAVKKQIAVKHYIIYQVIDIKNGRIILNL